MERRAQEVEKRRTRVREAAEESQHVFRPRTISLRQISKGTRLGAKKKKRPAFFSFCKGAVKLVGHIYASFDTRALGQPVFLEVVVALHVKQQLASEDADPFGTRLPLSSNLALSSQLRLQQREVHLQSRRPFPLQFFFSLSLIGFFFCVNENSKKRKKKERENAPQNNTASRIHAQSIINFITSEYSHQKANPMNTQ